MQHFEPTPEYGDPSLPTPGAVYDYLDMAHIEWDYTQVTSNYDTAVIAAKLASAYHHTALCRGFATTHSYSES